MFPSAFLLFFLFLLLPVFSVSAQNYEGKDFIAIEELTQESDSNNKEKKESLDVVDSISDEEELSQQEQNAYVREQLAAIKDEDYKNKVKLQAINKITARPSTIEAELSIPVTFGNIKITMHRCWQAPEEEVPESKALLEVWEYLPGEDGRRIFYGWMFSSSPEISAIEHPVYDIIVLECME